MTTHLLIDASQMVGDSSMQGRPMTLAPIIIAEPFNDSDGDGAIKLGSAPLVID